MVEVSVVKQKLQDYIVNQIDILGESNPAIKLVKPLAKRAIINNIDSFDKFINTIAKDGKIDIEGIVDEEIEKERLLNNSSLSFLFKIKSYICIYNIKLNAYGNIC